jgi:peptide/nickel transport system permease protein
MVQHVSTASATTPTGAITLDQLEKAELKKHRSLWNNAWRQFRHHRLALAGLIVFVSLVLITFVGAMVYPRDKDYIDFMVTSLPPFQSWKYPLGTDTLGRDILARLLWGGRVSIAVGVISAGVAITIGTLVGAIAGFFGGFADSLLMRVTDLFISLPQVPLLLMVSFLFRDSFYNWFDREFNNGNLGVFVLIVLVLAALSWMPTARLVRASFLSLKEKEFVEAARAVGVNRPALIMRHILPNSLSPIIVAATLSVGAAIIGESVLSFLGLGFPSDVPTWGRMLFEAKDFLQLSPHEAMIPGTAIFIIVLSINYIGDGLRDALDPRKTQ